MPKIFAFYLPQFHEIPENNLWWGQGFTAWDNVKKATSLFEGHNQPIEPLNDNYYNLLNIETMKWQTELLHKYKVDGLIYYHYWFNGYQLLEKPVENLLANKSIDQKFFFCWANHSWTNRWLGIDEKILVKQTYGEEEEWEEHFSYLLRFFKDDRYEKIDNKPLLNIYVSSGIIRKSEMIAYWNLRCIEEGFNGIYIIETYHRELDEQFKKEYIKGLPILLHEPNMSSSILKNYDKTIINNIPIYKNDFLDVTFENRFNFDNTIKCLVFGFDNTPRWHEKGKLIEPLTKEHFLKLMNDVKNDDYLFINAWNEWDEGMILEPTKKDGYKYLEWIKEWKENNEEV